MSSSSQRSLFPGRTTFLVGILPPNVQAEHSSCCHCPLLHLPLPLRRSWLWCHRSCLSWSHRLLFNCLWPPLHQTMQAQLFSSCSVILCARPFTILVALCSGSLQFLDILLKPGGHNWAQFPIFYLTSPYEIKMWESDLFYLK